MKIVFTLMCASFALAHLSAVVVEEKVEVAPVVEEKVVVEHPHYHHYHEEVIEVK